MKDGLLQGLPQEAAAADPSQETTSLESLLAKDDLPVLEQYVANGLKLAHESKLAERMQTGGDPVEAAAFAVSTITNRLEEMNAPDMVKFIGGVVLLNQIAPEMSEEDRVQALAMVIGDYLDRGVKEGRYTPEELQQSGQEAAIKAGINLEGTGNVA